MDLEQMKKEFLKMVQEQSRQESLMQRIAKTTTMQYLKSAFKEPEEDENGYALRPLPIISTPCLTYDLEGREIINAASAIVGSNNYAKYIDTPCIIVDEYQSRLLLFLPDGDCSALALRGTGWHALSIKEEYQMFYNILSLYDQLKASL